MPLAELGQVPSRKTSIRDAGRAKLIATANPDAKTGRDHERFFCRIANNIEA